MLKFVLKHDQSFTMWQFALNFGNLEKKSMAVVDLHTKISGPLPNRPQFFRFDIHFLQQESRKTYGTVDKALSA